MTSDPRYPQLASGPIFLLPQYRQGDYADQRNVLAETCRVGRAQRKLIWWNHTLRPNT